MTESIDPNTPLRLARAAALAFPNGGMTEKGLRRERARGNLTIERIANKDYTTLAYIEEMRRRCRLEVATAPSIKQKAPLGTSRKQGSADALLKNLDERSKRLKSERLRNKTSI